MSATQNIKFAAISSLGTTISLAATSLLVASPIFAAVRNQSDIVQTSPNYQIAQVFRSTVSLPVGQEIAAKIDRQETLYIAKGETVNANLVVAKDVVANNGTVLIPSGAVIEGQFVPAEGGSKFVAQKFTSRGATVTLQAESALMNDVKDPRETNAGSILVDSGLGGAAGAVLGGVLRGNVQIIDILGGAAAGAIIGNVTAPQVTVIEPNLVINVVTKQTLTFAVRDDF